MHDAVLAIRYGDLAPDIAYLREIGKLVAPFKDGFRIGSEVVSGEELRERARSERKRRASKPTTPPELAVITEESPMSDANGHAETTTEACGCGKPARHRGSCWVRRGLSAPPERKTGQRAAGAKDRPARRSPVKPKRAAAAPTANPLDVALEALKARLVRIQGAIVALEMAKSAFDD